MKYFHCAHLWCQGWLQFIASNTNHIIETFVENYIQACTVRTSRQSLCNQRVGCLLCSMARINYPWDGSTHRFIKMHINTYTHITYKHGHFWNNKIIMHQKACNILRHKNRNLVEYILTNLLSDWRAYNYRHDLIIEHLHC